MNNWIADYIRAQKAALDSIPVEQVAKLIDRLNQAVAEDRQIFCFGNGGSAANASHFATDLGKGSSDKIGKRFRVLSLNDNVSWMTALGNDYAYEDIFVRQLQNYARPGDVVLALSVSGNSPNVVAAVQAAHAVGAQTLAVVGYDGGRLRGLAQHVFWVPSHDMQLCEDLHLMFGHLVMKSLCRAPLVLD